MPQVFMYKARTRDGEVIVGEMSVPAIRNVLDHLWGLNYTVVSVEPKTGTGSNKKALPIKAGGFSLSFLERVKAKELAFFCRQLSTMIDSGVPLLKALGVLYQQRGPKRLQAAIGVLREELQKGSSFSEAASKSRDVFPPLFVNMVKAGEMGGTLDEILDRLADYFDKEHEIIEKIKSAMTYPMFLFLVAVGAITFLLGFILPKFVGLLQDLDVELPLITRVVMGISDIVTSFWYVGVGLITAGILGARYLLKDPKNKLILDTLILKIPIFGSLIKKREISRFSKTLAILQRSGVPVLQAMEVVKRVTSNLLIQNTVSNSQLSIREGRGLADPLADSGVFPDMVVQMVQIGEETGNLEEMLEKVSSFYEREVDVMVSRLSSLIEPIFIVVLAGTMGLVLTSVLLPIFKMITSIQ